MSLAGNMGTFRIKCDLEVLDLPLHAKGSTKQDGHPQWEPNGYAHARIFVQLLHDVEFQIKIRFMASLVCDHSRPVILLFG